MPAETKKFKKAEDSLRSMLDQVFAKPTCLELIKIEGLNENLEQCIRDLEVCEKKLNVYLEHKKKKFPRFYFPSNADLLETLTRGAT